MLLQVLVHGVAVPTDTPVQWLCEHFGYPDNFVHLCVFV
jgi:autophagy-related protein 5